MRSCEIASFEKVSIFRAIFVSSLHRFSHSHEILIYDAFLDEIMWDKGRGQVESARLCAYRIAHEDVAAAAGSFRPFSMPLGFPIYFYIAFYHGLKRCFELIHARS